MYFLEEEPAIHYIIVINKNYTVLIVFVKVKDISIWRVRWNAAMNSFYRRISAVAVECFHSVFQGESRHAQPQSLLAVKYKSVASSTFTEFALRHSTNEGKLVVHNFPWANFFSNLQRKVSFEFSFCNFHIRFCFLIVTGFSFF